MSSKGERKRLIGQLTSALASAPRSQWAQDVMLLLSMLEAIDPRKADGGEPGIMLEVYTLTAARLKEEG
jgi:hypothetical protein